MKKFPKKQTDNLTDNMIHSIIKPAFVIIAVILFIDAICFLAWALSGQTPTDGFYAGALTAHVLGFIF